MSTLRVMAVTPDLRTGGAERHLATLLPELDRDRFTVAASCVQARGPFFDTLVAQGVPVTALDVGGSPWSLPRALGALTRRMHAFQPDVVLTTGASANLVGRLAARAVGTPVIGTWKHNCGHLGRHGLSDRVLEGLLSPVTSRYFAVSYAQVRYLTDYTRLDPTRIRVVYNGIDPALHGAAARPEAPGRGALGLEEDQFLIGVVAVFREEKDHPTLLRAFRAVAQIHDRARLVLIGDGPARESLERLADELGIRERITFLGYRADVEDLLPLLDAVALASTTIENCPYAILEAMAASKPAVCTAVGGLPELIDEGTTGYLVPARDPSAMARRLASLVADPELARKMGRAGRQRLEAQFSLAGAARRVEAELVEAVREASSTDGDAAP